MVRSGETLRGVLGEDGWLRTRQGFVQHHVAGLGRLLIKSKGRTAAQVKEEVAAAEEAADAVMEMEAEGVKVTREEQYLQVSQVGVGGGASFLLGTGALSAFALVSR